MVSDSIQYLDKLTFDISIVFFQFYHLYQFKFTSLPLQRRKHKLAKYINRNMSANFLKLILCANPKKSLGN